ncbi:hypothetical protein EAH89_29730 [Roseomonas nepalensis]|uniref:DUF2384 domain-containing protein n=1 Tax=Muricoccus nepalensis TaxID=1854500 RepID=A0A502ENZ0_9PROT|nr:hypothetical protein [Roseomonas nepalensis]TPG37951.1 hypothetical protein EAH89_29730 [Roseomonas nepalensis]
MTRAVPDARSLDDLGPLADRLLAELPALFLRQHPTVLIGSLDGGACWRDEGDIDAVEHEGVEYVPAFQLRDGRPHPTIRAVLAAFPPELTAWDRAYWFVSSEPGLGGRRPCEALDDVEALVASARQAGAEIIAKRHQTKRNLDLHAQAGRLNRASLQ